MDDLISREMAIGVVGRRCGACIQGILDIPAAQTDSKKSSFTHKALDTISRQAAINIERNATVDTNPSHFEAHQKFTQFMDDAEVSSFGRWQWSNGFNTALTAVGIDLKKLPSAQQWTPCSERLPEESGLYIVTNVGRWVEPVGTRYYNIRADGGFWSGHPSDKVLAWMPLPAPYKEDTND